MTRTPADDGFAAARAENVQSIAAAEVRAAHRIQCLDETRAALAANGFNVTETNFCSRIDADVDALMNGRSSAEVARIITDRRIEERGKLTGSEVAVRRLTVEIGERARAIAAIATCKLGHFEMVCAVDDAEITKLDADFVTGASRVQRRLRAGMRALELKRDEFVRQLEAADRMTAFLRALVKPPSPEAQHVLAEIDALAPIDARD